MPFFTAIGVAAFGAGTFLASATAFGLQMVAGIGLSYAAQAMAGKPANQQQAANRVGGVQGKLQAGGDVPRSFPLGYSVTAGSLVYANTWGKDGETPNAYLTQVISLSDLPTVLKEVYVNGELATLLTGEPHADYGIPVQAYRKDGKDHLWIKFHDGTQTTADTFVTNSVSSTERPYGPDRIGKGIAYAVCTALVNDELFTGFPQFRFTLEGIKLYDPSRDDTAGGSGSHRWSDPSTWGGDGDSLPAVQAYNVLRGITYGGQWLYGLQASTVAQLPSEAWINAIVACRAPIQGETGVEPIYRAGHECRVNERIDDTIEVLLTTCQAKLSEAGGIYKMHVGEPGAPVLTFTDSDILSSEEQSFTPFFGLADTINGIAATYPEPSEGWATKAAPPLLDEELEALDGGRRLMADVKFDAVPYTAQVQRLMQSALREAQRARRHTFVLPPEYWLLEPGDVVGWTSARNGYVTKLFRVDGVADKANLDVLVDLTEVDPDDFDWDHETDFTPVPRNPIVFVRPSAQAVLDWYAEGATVYDANGLARRPAILLEWNGTVTSDIAAIQFEVREDFGAMEIVHRGRSENVAAGSILVSQNLLPNTAYQVRGRYIPGNPRDTLWSDWIAVTTPNILVGEKDIVQSLLYQMQELQDEMDRRMSLVENGMQTSANSSARSIRDNTRLRGQTVKMVERVELRVDDAEASIEDVRELAVSNEGAIASLSTSVDARFATTNANVTTNAQAIAALDYSFSQYQVTVNAQLGNLSSSVTTNAQAIAALDYSFSQYQVTVNAQLGNLSSSVTTNATAIAGIGAQYTVLLDANGYVSGTKQLNGGPGASSFTVLADFFQVAKPGVAGGAPVPVITLGSVNGVQKLALRGDMLADGTITARNILAGSITADKLQANSIGTNQLAVGGVDITNLIAGAATQVTSHDGGALSLTAPGTLFDLVSSGP
ncbi:tail protein, partial [Afipia sp. P52-10]|uniref:phage tail protein n=1 Tax=Afipia sp. P52-10 TaxID=1429916 RepID=UPI0003DF2745